MPARVSHSLLDPYLTVPLRNLYPRLPIPRSLPPEAIVVAGNLAAWTAAACFAFADRSPWVAIAGSVGVMLYHAADVLDGRHARATDQCRNGGELLDHFFDPVSLSLLCCGWAWLAGLPLFAPAAVMVVMAHGLLENLKAKLGANFEVARFGPTELKTSFAVLLTAAAVLPAATLAAIMPPLFIATLAVSALALPLAVYRGVRAVNASRQQPDTADWRAAA